MKTHHLRPKPLKLIKSTQLNKKFNKSEQPNAEASVALTC